MYRNTETFSIARFWLTLLAALITAFAVVFGTLEFFSSVHTSPVRPSPSYSDAQKLQLLAALRSTSSTPVSLQQQKHALSALRASSSVSESQKLDILRALHDK